RDLVQTVRGELGSGARVRPPLHLIFARIRGVVVIARPPLAQIGGLLGTSERESSQERHERAHVPSIACERGRPRPEKQRAGSGPARAAVYSKALQPPRGSRFMYFLLLSSAMRNSVRRFFCLPSSVALSAIGFSWPQPTESKRSFGTPLP